MQALNGMARAILDINDVYKPFLEQNKPEAKVLEGIMLAIARERETLIVFSKAAWDLDEDGLMSYL
jgi:hypothetical protein